MPPIMKDGGKGDGDNSPQDSESMGICPQPACQCCHGWGSEGGLRKTEMK